MKPKTAKDFIAAIGDDEAKKAGRQEYLRGMVAQELLTIQTENEERNKEGKPLIPEEDRELSIRGGVVISAWRAKEQAKAKREAERVETEMSLDVLGYTSGR